MYGSAFQPASPQLPGQVLIASTTASGLSPNTHRYKSISNNAGLSPKPTRRSALPINVALSCSVKKRSQTRSAMSYLRLFSYRGSYHRNCSTVKTIAKEGGHGGPPLHERNRRKYVTSRYWFNFRNCRATPVVSLGVKYGSFTQIRTHRSDHLLRPFRKRYSRSWEEL